MFRNQSNEKKNSADIYLSFYEKEHQISESSDHIFVWKDFWILEIRHLGHCFFISLYTFAYGCNNYYNYIDYDLQKYLFVYSCFDVGSSSKQLNIVHVFYVMFALWYIWNTMRNLTMMKKETIYYAFFLNPLDLFVAICPWISKT